LKILNFYFVFQAQDLDVTYEYSALKYLINTIDFLDTDDVFLSSLIDKDDLRLDQLTGNLYKNLNTKLKHLTNLNMQNDMSLIAYNYLDTNSLSHYCSSRNEIKFRLTIRFNLNVNLLKEYDLRIDTNDDLTVRLLVDDCNEFSSIEKCWLDDDVNCKDSLKFTYGLERQSEQMWFYFFEKNPLVWSMPFSVSLRYEHRCSIITGNIFDTFYLNRRKNGGLVLVRELDFMLKPVYNLVIRCTSSQITPMEIDMELNVEIVKENFYAYVLAQNLLVFDADVYEFSIGFNEDNNRNLHVLGKVNAFYPRLVKNERIVYRYLTSDESLLEFQKVFLLNGHTGQVYVNVKNFNENLSRYCLDVNYIDTLKMSAYFLITVKAFNQVIEKRIKLKLLPQKIQKSLKNLQKLTQNFPLNVA
jgi:hypothetical protein